MMKHTIITIGRQFGSGGHEVGNRLAERLDIPLYDHNLLHMAAQELRISNEDATRVDETVLGRFLSAYAASSVEYRAFVTSDESGKPLSDKVFEKQSAIIRKLAEQGPGIFVGRCADYVLDGMDGLVRIFLYADMDYRVERITRLGYYDPKDVKKNIKRIDRERRDYHRYYTGKDWENVENYDLMLNTARLGTDGAVEAVKNYLALRGYELRVDEKQA